MAKEATTEKCYYSRSKRHAIDCHDIASDDYFNNGRLKQRTHVIQFSNFLYTTSDAREQKMIESTTDFKIGKITVMSGTQATKFLEEQAKRMNLPVDQVEPKIATPGQAGY